MRKAGHIQRIHNASFFRASLRIAEKNPLTILGGEDTLKLIDGAE
jgi:hypothetical protein